MSTYLTGEPTDDAANELIALRAEVVRLQGLLKGFSRDMAEEIERLTRQRDEARAEAARRLKVIAKLYLWPDDAGPLIAENVRSRNDWDEASNDAESTEYGITRGEIRAARKALEAKP